MEEYQIYILLIAFVVLMLFATIAVGLIYFFGLFYHVEVSSGKPKFQFWDRKIAYIIASGHCWECSQYFTELTSLLPKQILIGVYMQLKKQPNPDDPQDLVELRREFSSDFKPDKDICKFLVGAFIQDETGKILVDDEDLKKLREKKYKIGVLPKSDNVVYSSFPFRGVFSVPIAIKKVYPKMMQYISERRLCAYPAMEIYNGEDIQFMFPLSQQADFLDIFDDNSEESSEEMYNDSETEIETVSHNSNNSDTSETSSFEKL